jgi:peptide chain release factor
VPAFPVSAKKANALRERLVALHCSEGDFEEFFFGRTGVELRHRASGIRVRSRQRGCQALNRFIARRLLADELEARLQNKTRRMLKAEKIREAKRRNTRRGVASHLSRLGVLVLSDQQPACGQREKNAGLPPMGP